MTGIIKTYLDEKNYGFIKGDDARDYFFHTSSIDRHDLHKVCEGALVSFDQKATPKGYSAIKISVGSAVKYVLADTIYASKSDRVKGWDIIDLSDWLVHGSSRHSPDEAKKDMLLGVDLVRANAALNMEYYKTTGSEAGTGNGTHYYTIHNFRARPANIGRRSLTGSFSKNDLVGLNEHAGKLKSELVKKTAAAKTKRALFWLVLLSIAGLSWIVKQESAVLISAGLIIVGFFLSHATDYDSWLEEIR